MAMNIGGGYQMGGMPMMGSMTGMGNNGTSANVNQYFTEKYGCEDCFRKEPYWKEYPKPLIPEVGNSLKPSLFKRLLNNILGG